MKFLDLQKDLYKVKSGAILNKDCNVFLYAIGGFPIVETNNDFYFLNQKIDESILKNEINKVLGLSGLLTYLNKSNLSIENLGQKCRELNHTWAYNWITLSFLIIDETGQVEKTFLRSTKFYESWSVSDNIKCFGITGSIKNFIKFIKNKEDKSFDVETRIIMEEMYKNYSMLWN